MPTKKIDQALILMEKAGSLLRDAKEEIAKVNVKPASQPTTNQPVDDSVNLKADKWPMAVNPNLICSPDNDMDKVDRANGVVELMIEENLNGKKFLDFGCGEGHIVDVSTKHNTVISVGYDIVENKSWAGKSGNLTTDMNFVEASGPYDVIIMFDVLDHVAPHDNLDAPKSILAKAAELLSPKGKIYLRCHPWTSRHATHMYHWENKAYAHLVCTDEELKDKGIKLGEPTQKVIRPIATYRSWIKNSGLKVDNERIIKEPVEEFFKAPKIADRIQKNVRMDCFPEFQMSIQFVDYILAKA
jgi:2-polyprenyl-3-methyl-5-hydroxy-6-metoxy-1,4-benzoquinol methylase